MIVTYSSQGNSDFLYISEKSGEKDQESFGS